MLLLYMVLQSSGTISFGQIRTEYLLSGTVGLGSNCRLADIRVPQSGTLSFSNLYGKYYMPMTGLTVWLDGKDGYSGSGTTWTDFKGNANATLSNAPTWTSPYLSFNGTSQFATIPSITNITDFSGTQAYSVSFWAWLAATQNNTGNVDNDIVEKWTGGTAYPYVIRYNRPVFSIATNTFNGTTSYGSLSSSNSSIATNAWSHVTAVFDWPATTTSLYINGVIAASNVNATITGTISNSSPVYLMMRGNNTNHVTGRLAMVCIYNRALTAVEASNVYQSTRGVVGV